MRSHGWISWTALVLALVLGTRAAQGSVPPRIVILAPTADDHISLRLQAELRTLRFDVPEVELAPGPPSRAQLEEAARKSEAVAAVRIVPSSAGVEVWIVDRMTGKTVLRELVTTGGDSASRDATIALRVVELLRASLMELDAARPPQGEVAAPPMIRQMMTPHDTPAPAPPPALPPPAPPSFSIELGPAALLSPGGFGPSGLVSAAVHYRPAATIGASLFALIPILPATVSGPEGTTTARSGLLGAGIRATYTSPSSPWTPSLAAGIAAIWLHLDGEPAPHFTGTSANVFSAAPYLRPGLGLTLLPRLRLRADALCGVALPPAVVKFGTRTAAVWGAPFVVPALGLELLWP